MIRRLWDSPTFTTWASLSTQSISLLVVLPLVLTRFTQEEITVYYLFATIIGLEMVFQLGFRPTFVRLVGYAHAGRRIADMEDLREGGCQNTSLSEANSVESLHAVCGTMRYLFRRFGLGALLVMGTAGTLLMVRPIGRIEETQGVWLAWGVICAVGAMKIWFQGFEAYLNGANHVALFQRWQAIFNLFGIFSSFLVLFLAPSLMNLILVNQFWMGARSIRDWHLVGRITQGQFRDWADSGLDQNTLHIAWPKAWRSAVGQIGGTATQQSLGLILAQFGSGPGVASYLVGMRLVKALEQFSMAPFYSKVPRMNRLIAGNKLFELKALAERSMRFAHFVYAAGFSGLCLLGPFLLNQIGANVAFPDTVLWMALGVGFFFQRFGGMHMQLYSTTNHILWHIANGIGGSVIIIFALILGPTYGGKGFALAILIGNLSYAVYSARKSYGVFITSPFQYELRTSFPALVLILASGFLAIGFPIESFNLN